MRAAGKLLKANGGYTYVFRGGWYYGRREKAGYFHTDRAAWGARNPIAGEWEEK